MTSPNINWFSNLFHCRTWYKFAIYHSIYWWKNFFFKLVNIWRSYRQNGWLLHALHSPKLSLIVVMLIGILMWLYCQQISNCSEPILTYWPTDWRHQWLTNYWLCMAFCCNSFSLLRQLCTVGYGFFLCGRCKQLFVSELNDTYFSKHF